MKKELFYRMILRRSGGVGFFLMLFFSLSSIPRLLLEVFIRKDFGERYFSFSLAIIVTIILAGWPLMPSAFSSYYMGAQPDKSLVPYITWYIYLAAFLVLCVKHQRDLKRNPSVFDFAKFSLYAGKINPWFYSIQFPDRKTDIRRVECLLEPGLFFIAGFFLYMFGQALGGLLMACSIIYSLGYVAAYAAGDNFIMDQIDQIILNEELEKVFMDDADESETRGVRDNSRKPQDKDLRRRVLDHMTKDDEVFRAR